MNGGGGGTTSQSDQYQSLSPWASKFITSILGAGQSQVFTTDPKTGQITGINPYHAYGTTDPNTGARYGMSGDDMAAAKSSVAAFTPLQEQAYKGAADLSVPGQYDTASGAASQGITRALNAGQDYASMATNPYAVQSYMNPYLQSSLAPQLQLLGQQTGIQSAAQQGAATQAGAFGGSRSALANALAQQSGNLLAQKAIGEGYNTAFDQAQRAQQFGAGLGLQGAQTGITGANTLAGIGGQRLAAEQGILGLQNQFGGQQQQQQQNIINQAMQNYQNRQDYGMKQLGQLKSLISGIPVTDVTTTQQQAAPSTASTLAGLGTTGVAGLALYNATKPTTAANA